MSTDNKIFLEQEKNSTALLNNILDYLNHIPNTNHVVRSINHLNEISVPMVGAKSPIIGYDQQTDGVEGFVPAPKYTDSGKFLRGDGTWQTVITSIDPLQTEEYIYADSDKNTHAYPFLKPHNDIDESVGTLKYNKNLSFGRSERSTYTPGRYYTYTTLDIKQDSTKTKDVGITFKSASASGYTSTLLANIESLTSNSYAKMPVISGTLLTDGGFTVNGSVINNSSVTMNYGATINGTLLVNPKTGGNWSEGIILQQSADTKKALIGFMSSKSSSSDDGWFIYSHPELDGSINEDKSVFNIMHGGSAKASLKATTAGTWYLDRNLNISNTLNIANKYLTEFKSDTNTVMHTTSASKINYKTNTAEVSLLNGNTSVFAIDIFKIAPFENSKRKDIGGELKLLPRVNGTDNGSVWISNYKGALKIYNDKYASGSVGVIMIDATSPDSYPTGPYIGAKDYDINVKSVTSVGGTLNLGNTSKGVNLTSKDTYIVSSVPISTSATSTAVGSKNRFYRPVIVASTAPGTNDGGNGDVWIQYI